MPKTARTAIRGAECNGRSLQKEAAERVSDAEEHQDDAGHDHRDQRDHRPKAGSVSSVHAPGILARRKNVRSWPGGPARSAEGRTEALAPRRVSWLPVELAPRLRVRRPADLGHHRHSV